MSDDNRPNSPDEGDPEVHEVITGFGEVQMRSRFTVEEQAPGTATISIEGPFLDFLESLEDDEDDERKV
jgi:hypothetical protein